MRKAIVLLWVVGMLPCAWAQEASEPQPSALPVAPAPAEAPPAPMAPPQAPWPVATTAYPAPQAPPGVPTVDPARRTPECKTMMIGSAKELERFMRQFYDAGRDRFLIMQDRVLCAWH